MDKRLLAMGHRISDLFQCLPDSGSSSLKDTARMEKRAASAERNLRQMELFRQELIRLYGEACFQGNPVFPLKPETVRAAEQYLSDQRNIQFVLKPSTGFLAHKPKENDIHYFAGCIRLLQEYYSNLWKVSVSLSVLPQITAEYQTLAEACIGNLAPCSVYTTEDPASDSLYLGDLLLPLEPSSADLLPHGHWFDGTQLHLPFTYRADQPFSLFVECVSQEESTARSWAGELIRSLLYQVTRAMKPYTYQFLYFDPKNGGLSLEAFSAMSNIVNGNAFQMQDRLFPENRFAMLQTAATRDAVTEMRNTLESYMAAVPNVCSGFDSIDAYNAHQEQLVQVGRQKFPQLIPHRFVIFENIHNVADDSTKNLLQELIDGARKCGVSTIITSCRQADEDPTKGNSWANEQELRNRCSDIIVRYDTHGQIQISAATMGQAADPAQDTPKRYHYLYAPGDLHAQTGVGALYSAYTGSLRQAFQPQLNYDTAYLSRVDLDAVWGQSDGTEGITIPLGINTRGEVSELTLGNSDVPHAMLSGTTGCGKTTLLHDIINGIITRYHPQDVQLWLSDYKSNEFMRYIKHTPANIRYVATDTSPEYSFQFLDKIFNEMNRRQELFGSNASVQDYRREHGPDSMPRLLILVDECHILSDHIRDFPDYREKFERLLREMRAYGMTFFLSDQTGGESLRGFTDEAMKQVIRLSMIQREIADYNAAFAISNASEIPAITSLLPHEVVICYKIPHKKDDGTFETKMIFEKCKTLYLTKEEIQAISERSIDCYGPCENPQYVIRPQRTTVDWDTMLPLARQDVEESAVPLLYGVPTNMQLVACIPIEPALRENVMCIGASLPVQASLLELTVESLEHYDQPCEIYLLADPHSRLERLCNDWLRGRQVTNPHLHLIKKDEMLYATIHDLWKEKEYRRTHVEESFQDVFLLWLGLEDLSQNFPFYKTTQPDPRNGDMCYDASEDIKQLVTFGPQQKIFNIVFYQSPAALRIARSAPPESFRHKLALPMSREDAMDFLGTARPMLTTDEKPLGSDCAVYYDGATILQFKPFIGSIEGKKPVDLALLEQAAALEKQQLQDFRERKDVWLAEDRQAAGPEEKEDAPSDSAASPSMDGLDSLFGGSGLSPDEESQLFHKFELAFAPDPKLLSPEETAADPALSLGEAPPTQPLKLWYVWDGAANRQLMVCNGCSLHFGWDNTAGVWVRLTPQMFLFDTPSNSWQPMPLDAQGRVVLS